QRLETEGRSVAALVVNRVHPTFGGELSEGLRLRGAELRETTGTEAQVAAAQRLGALYDNLGDFNEIAARERGHLAGLTARIGSAAVAFVPFLSHDVHDLEALSEIGRLLFE
ncbi:MAG TPA: hypothetical protein VIK61_02440, partial [Acidimicrobiia bacterium]